MGVCTEIEVVGRSSRSWERAAGAAVKAAVESFADRCLVRRPNDSGATAPNFTAEVIKFEMGLNDGRIDHYKATVKVTFVNLADSASYLTPVSRSHLER
jgi:flavin-binding protein dodecin